MQRMSLIRPAISGVAMVLGVLPVVTLSSPEEIGPTWAWLLAAATAPAVIGAQSLLAQLVRPLPAGTRLEARAGVGRLQQVAFLHLAVAEAPVLVGFVLSVVAQGWLPAAIGGAISLVAINLAGPTEVRLTAWRDRLESAGGTTGV